GAVRFLMSLRATGEGHVSSIVFRTGVVTADLKVTLDPPPAKLHRARAAPDHFYERTLFARKLAEIGVEGDIVERVLRECPERFTIAQLSAAVERVGPTVDGVGQAAGP